MGFFEVLTRVTELLILFSFAAYISGVFSSIAEQYGQKDKILQELVNSIIQT